MRHRVGRLAQNHEQGALPGVREIERGSIQASGEVRVADRLGPELVLALQIQQRPLRVAVRKHLRPSAKTLISCEGLSTRHTWPSRGGGQRVRQVRRGQGAVMPAPERALGPLPHVDDVEQHPVPGEQEQRPQAIHEPEEALHARQRLRVVVRPGGRGGPGPAGSSSVPSSSTPVEIGRFS